MEFTLMQSVDDSKVLHGSLGHHLGAEVPFQTGAMQQQEIYEIQQEQIHSPVHGKEIGTQLYRLRLTGEQPSAKDLGPPQTAVSIMDVLPSPPRVCVPEGLRFRPAGWTELWWKRSCRKTQQDFPPSDFWEPLSVEAFSLSHRVIHPGLCLCLCLSMGLWTSPDGQTSWAWLVSQLDLGPALSPRSCLATARLCLRVGTISRPAPLTPFLWCGMDAGWRGPALQAWALSSNSSSYSSGNPHCALTQTAEHEPLGCVLEARNNSNLLDCISKQHTHQGRDFTSYSMTFNSSESLCTVWNLGVQNWSVNWSEFSGGRPEWHWDRALDAPRGEAKSWDLQSGAAMVSETFHSPGIFKMKLSSLARMTMLWAARWTDTF